MKSKLFLFLLFLSIIDPILTQSCLLQHQYQDDLGLCQACYHKCLTCLDSSIQCDSCNSQYYLNTVTYQCQSCIQGCSVCHNSSTCQTCNNNFYLNSNGTCSICTVGASSCTVSTISSCIEGYYLLNSICAKCIQNCQSCNNSVTCKSCYSSYYLNTDSTCTSCGSNCNLCSSNTACTECKTGYKPVSSSNTCTQCTGVGNLVYSQSTATCITCPNYCIKCDTSICYYCQQGYILSSDQKTCSQGGSILCYQSKGNGYTNCQVDINGCPSNTIQQLDTSSGYSIPTTVCLPKSFTSSSQFIYDTFTCGTSSNITNTYSFVTQPKYQSTIQVQLMIMTPIPTSVNIQYGQTLNQIITIPSSISGQPTIDSSCGTYVIWNTEATFSGTASKVSIITSNVYISQIYLQGKLCTVVKCATCTTNLDCTSCLSPYYLQLNECIEECQTGFYTYSTNMTCHITCPDKTYAISSEYLCKDCSENNCYLCSSLQVCLSCKSGYFLYNSTCVTDCQTSTLSTYYGDQQNNVCRQCPFPCKTCSVISNVTTCYSCNVGYLYNSQCVFVCPNGTHPLFTSTLLCQLCNSNSPYYCSTCSIDSTTCTSCISSYYLLNSQCLSSCPDYYYSNNSICQSCQSPCLTCSLTSLNCLTCSLGSYYYNSSISAGQCLLMCPNGTYNNYDDTTNPICSACSAQCQTCYGSLSTECLSCSNNYFLNGSSCLSSCLLDNSTYQNSIDRVCSSCIPPCRTCSIANGSECTSCTVGFLDQELCSLICNQTSFPLLTSTIYTCTSCPVTCYSCNSSSVCKSCVSPYLLLNNQCIQPKDCLSGYYNDTLNLLCSLCSSPCETCSDSITCITCISLYYLYNNSKCVFSCPSGTLLIGNKCESCDPSCLTCSGTISNCTSCFAYNNQLTYLFEQSCISSCPTLYYSDSSTSTCQSCSAPCLQCYSLYLCITCLDSSYYLYDNQCLEQCPSNTLPFGSICELCTDNCLTCKSVSGNCSSCSQLYYHYFNSSNDMGYCYEDCPTNNYNDIYTGTCLNCISPCDQCKSQTVCTTCISTHSLYIQTCIINCPLGYYSQNNICNVCVSPCSECSSLTNCTMCSEGYYMPLGDTWTENCLSVCPLGQYADNFNQQCSLCDTNCLNCSSLDVCYNCSGTSYLHLNTCLSQCLSGYYPLDNKCNACPTGCSRCSSDSVCSSCLNGYKLYNSQCLFDCPTLTYSSISVYENIMVCYNCSQNCLSCTDYYECTQCSPGYFVQNGLCASSCSLYYYPSPEFTCLPCGFSCSKCINQSYCLTCSNTYIHQNQCYSVCPQTTYSNYSSLTCLACISPCYTCINEHSCLTCIDNYKFYQSICVITCPNNTWLYNDQCVAECTKYKDYESNICYDQCPNTKVAQNNICLSECSPGSYVSIDRICTQCNGQQQCKYPFKGQLQLVAVDGFKLVLYFNQRAEILKEQNIKITIKQMQQSSKRLLIEYIPSSFSISDRSIQIFYSIPSSKMLKVTLQIPYILSQDSYQSINSNTFNLQIYNYQQPTPQFNFKILGYVVSIFILILFVINILYGVGHYRAVLELAQIFCMLNYLEIYYPWPLYQFYEGLQLIMFAPILNIASPYLYSFSPSKFINYNLDIEFMRNCLASILFIFLPIALFLGIICLVAYLKRQVKDEEAPKILKFCRIIRRRMFWRYLNDYFFVGMVWMGVFAVATFRNSPLSYTIFTYVLSTIAIIVIVAVIVFIFFLVFRSVRKRKRDLEQIDGLVQDLQVDSSTLGLMYTPILYLRKLLLICLIGLYSTYPISSLFMLMVLSALLLVILFFYKPFKNPVTDYIVVCLELCLILTIFLLVLLKMNQDILPDQAQFGIGLTVVIIDMLILLVAVGWWGYLTITDYAMKLGFNFGQTQSLNHNNQQMIGDNSNIDQIKQNKLDMTDVLNDVTNKPNKRNISQFNHIKGQQDNNQSNNDSYNIYDNNNSESNVNTHSQSGQSKDLFKHYKQFDDDQEKDLVLPSRLQKKPVEKEQFQNVQKQEDD